MKTAVGITALLLVPALALAAPSTRMQPGLWKFDYHTSVEMGGRKMPVEASSVQRCITETNPEKLPLMPKLPANIHCSAPQMQTTAVNYNVRMSCTASEPNGMLTNLDEDFFITPGPHGDTLQIKGTVHERITGGPIPLPSALTHIEADGRRLGACPKSIVH